MRCATLGAFFPTTRNGSSRRLAPPSRSRCWTKQTVGKQFLFSRIPANCWFLVLLSIWLFFFYRTFQYRISNEIGMEKIKKRQRKRNQRAQRTNWIVYTDTQSNYLFFRSKNWLLCLNHTIIFFYTFSITKWQMTVVEFKNWKKTWNILKMYRVFF